MAALESSFQLLQNACDPAFIPEDGQHVVDALDHAGLVLGQHESEAPVRFTLGDERQRAVHTQHGLHEPALRYWRVGSTLLRCLLLRYDDSLKIL